MLRNCKNYHVGLTAEYTSSRGRMARRKAGPGMAAEGPPDNLANQTLSWESG